MMGLQWNTGSPVAVRAGTSLLGQWLPSRVRQLSHSLWSADVSTCLVPRTLSSYGDRLLQPRDLACGTPFQSSCVILTSPTDRSDDSWRDTFFGKHEHGAVRLLTCGAIEKHLLTYLLTVKLCVCVYIRHMSGPSDNDFYGSMRGNITYHMGPGYHPPQLNWYICILLPLIDSVLKNVTFCELRLSWHIKCPQDL